VAKLEYMYSTYDPEKGVESAAEHEAGKKKRRIMAKKNANNDGGGAANHEMSEGE